MNQETRSNTRLIVEAAFQVCDASLDADSLFQEACSLAKKFREVNTKVAFEEILCATASNVRKSGSNISRKCMLSTPWIAKQVNELVRQCDVKSSPLCPDDIKDQWNTCFHLVEDSIRQNVFIPDLFLSMLSQHILPLEMMWSLHTVGAFDLQKYLVRELTDSSASQQLARSLLQLCCHGCQSDESRRRSTLTGVFSLVVKKGFEGTHLPGDTKVFLKIIDIFLAGFLGADVKCEDSVISPFGENLTGLISENALRKCSLHVLSNCLCHGSRSQVCESLGDLSHILPVTDRKLLLLVNQLLVSLESREALELLSRSLECDQANVRMTCYLVTALLSHDVNNGSVLKEHVQLKLSAGLQSSEAQQTAVAFFMARQGCCLKSKFFRSYRDWYQETFGDANSSPATSRASFSFLVKCLRDWVPRESAEYLKTHILRKPFIPPRMKDCYDSYVLLAKTRLSDLKVPVNDPWFEGPSEVSHNASKNQSSSLDPIADEVEHAVQSFGETGRVPTSILEASIFRKPYFVGKFLPMLLKARCLPDVPDAKVKLIAEVWKSGKIPGSVYSHYLESCEKERQALLEGVFDLDDDDAEEEMVLLPIEQLEFQLERLNKAVVTADDHKIRETVSLVIERIGFLLPNADRETKKADEMNINLTATSGTLENQIVLKILQRLTEILRTIRENNQASTGLIYDTWLTDLTRRVVDFPSLRLALVSFVFNCLSKKTTPGGLSTDALAVMTLCLRCLLPVTAIEVYGEKGPGNSCHVRQMYSDLVKLVSDCLSCQSGHDIIFSLRYLLVYTSEALHYFKDIRRHIEESDVVIETTEETTISEMQLLPVFLIKQVHLLSWRLQTLSSESSGIGDKISFSSFDDSLAVLKSDAWRKIAKEIEPSFVDLVKFELGIDPCMDCLAARQRQTYFWAKTGEFSPKLDTSLMCSEVFKLLAENPPKSSRSLSFQVYEGSWMDFMTLLKNLLLQLPCSSGAAHWLLSALTSRNDKNRSKMLRLIPSLHPFLLLSNSMQEDVTENDVKAALSVLDMLARSDLNEGGYLSLDITIAFGQACKDRRPSTSGVHLSQVLSHPLVFTSMLVHKGCIENLSILNCLPENWVSLLRFATSTTPSSLTEDCDCFTETSTCQEWMKAAAVFATVLQWTEEEIFPESVIFQQSQECQLYVMEYLVVFFFHDLLKLEQPHKLKKVFKSVLLKSPQLTENLFDDHKFPLTQWRHKLGICESSKHMRIFCILRMCREMPVNDLSAITGKGITSLISAYISLLQYAQENMDVYVKVSIEDLIAVSHWLRQVIDESNTQSFYGLDLAVLRQSDPLFYRHVQLRLRRQ